MEYLFLVAVAIIIVAVVIKYVEPAAKEVPITGIAYIDPEFSPVVEEAPQKNKMAGKIQLSPGARQQNVISMYLSTSNYLSRNIKSRSMLGS